MKVDFDDERIYLKHNIYLLFLLVQPYSTLPQTP